MKSSDLLTTSTHFEDHRRISKPECNEEKLNLNVLTFSTDSVEYTDRHMSDCGIGFEELLDKMSCVDEKCAFTEHGYKKLHKLSDTMQGNLWKAQDMNTNEYVAIKRTKKSLLYQGIAIDRETETSFCVSENIIKESVILKHLTVDNGCIGDYILKYIDFFASDNDYFLVMEYVPSETNLKQFLHRSHKYIKAGKLKLKHYQRIIKYLVWQLLVTVNWMHNDMNCAHLDIVTENIMVQNADFGLGKDGYYVMNPKISIKLADFGISEIYRSNTSFMCEKTGLTLENEAYVSPQIYNHSKYDGRLADAWSLGMVLYECLVGQHLYTPADMWQKNVSGYQCLHNGLLKEWLFQNKIIPYFPNDSLQILLGLLTIEENKRANVRDIIEYKWFKLYYLKYRERLAKKSICQKQQLLKQKTKMEKIPFYDPKCVNYH